MSSWASSSSRLPPVCPHALPSGPRSSSPSWGCRPSWSACTELVAFGHRRLVVVVDGRQGVPAQILDGHSAHITSVVFRDVANALELASGDVDNRIIVWDVVQANVIASMRLTDSSGSSFKQHHNARVTLQWLGSRVENSSHLLLALHNNNLLVLWDAFEGRPLWTHSFHTEGINHVFSFDIDPFDPHRLVLRSNKGLVFINDLQKHKAPKMIRKLHVNLSESFSSTKSNKEMRGTRIRSFVKELVTNAKDVSSGDSESGETSDLADCLDVVFHRSCRNHLALLLPRDILLLDLELEQTTGSIGLSNSASPFQQVLFTRLRDCIFTLQESGVVSFRHRDKLYTAVHPDLSRQTSSVSSTPIMPSSSNSSNEWANNAEVLEMVYDARAVSDVIRLGGKNVRVTGMAINPVTESDIALLTSECKLYLLQLQPQYGKVQQKVVERGTWVLDEMITGGPSSNSSKSLLRLFTRGLTSFLPSPPYVMRMCPPVTMKSLDVYTPLLAVGSTSGNLLIINLSHVAKVEREFAVHTFPVMGIEWASIRQVISFAHHQGVNNSSLVRNELVVTDVRTGRTNVLRSGQEDEPPIDKLRVSHLKQYFIVAFQGAPFELWDLKSGRLLRTMPKRFPPVTAIEWSPLHNLKSLKKKAAAQIAASSAIATTDDDNNNKVSEERELSIVDESSLVAKEHFVFTDPEGQLYHFSVEGNAIRDGTKLPAEPTLGHIGALTWKGDVVVRADTDGNVNVWNVRSRSSTNFSVGSPIKKVRFAPGKGNMKLLILGPDAVSLYNANQGKLLESTSCNHHKTKFLKPMDIDWAASDRPLIALEDGTLLVTSFELSRNHVLSPMTDFKWGDNDNYCYKAMMSAKQRRWLEAKVSHCESSNALETLFKNLSTNHPSSSSDNDDSNMILSRYTASLPNGFRQLMMKPLPLLDRLLLSCRIGGSDPWYSDFWRVARASMENGSDFALDSCFDLMCHKTDFLASVEAQLSLFESRLHIQSNNASLRHRVIDLKLLLDHKTDAMRLLIDSEPQHNSHYYEDCLKACLISATLSNEQNDTSQHYSTVKLVATNLIAEGHVWKGVQLLCLIGRVLDACSYLQADNKWYMAMWIAKCRLNAKEDFHKVLVKHSEHLISEGQRRSAALLYLASHDYVTTLETLLQMREIALAALFVQLAVEKKLMPDTSHALVLIEKTHLAYARYLYFECGVVEEALHFCDKADEKGELLRREIEARQREVNQ